VLLSTYRYTPAAGWDEPLDSVLDSDSTLLIAFGASAADNLISGIADLRRAFPRSIWIGCSTAGEIYGRSLEDNTLAVAVMKFTHTILRVATREIVDPQTSFQAGSYLASTLDTPNLRGVFVLSDGLSVNGAELAKGLSQNLPQGVVVTGGWLAMVIVSRIPGCWWTKRPALTMSWPLAYTVSMLGLLTAHGEGGTFLGLNARSLMPQAMCSIPWMDNPHWRYIKNISAHARQVCRRQGCCFRLRYAMISKKMV